MNQSPRAAVATELAELKGLGIKPLASLRAHWQVAKWVFVLVLVAGAPFAWIKGAPKYVATATVQIAPNYMKNLKDDKELEFQSNQQYRQFVEHQARSVGRIDILSAALAALGDKASAFRQPGESERRAVQRLRDRINVNAVPDTYLMQISLESDRREGVAEVVNATVEAYISKMKDEQMFGAEDRVKNLQQREAQVVADIKSRTQRRTAIALELGVTSFSEGDGNPYDKVLSDTRAAVAEARNVRIAAEAKLSAFNARGETDIATRSIKENILTDPGLNSLKASLNSRRAALATAVSGLTPQHPAFEAARQELAEIDRQIQQQTDILYRDVSRSMRSRFEMTVEQAQRYEVEVGKALREQEKISARFAALFNEAQTLSAELAQINKELDSIRERINFFAAEHSALGFVRLVTPALVPEEPQGVGRRKMLMLVIMAALFAALAAPLAIDLADRSVRTVNDAERTLRMPSMGWLVERDGRAANLLADDQLRRIAGGLIREQSAHGSKVVAFCGVKPGAGSTVLTLELAATLNALGYPTLVVEANAFSPDARFATGLPGLAQCLNGEAAPLACVAEAGNQLPARVGVGTAEGVRHLDRLDRMQQVIGEWAERFSFVLVDMPPLLLSADAEILLGSLGQAVLVVEAGGISHGELARAGRLLEKSVSRAAGLIVNRVRAVMGGYMRNLLVEYVTQRKFSEFETRPVWHLAVQSYVSAAWERMRSALHTKGVGK
jgi:Mrp family chromosome partitioning ATPase/uncharacterized protein involved in exopolysaccharide biosynthesis